MAAPGARPGRVTRITGDDVYVELTDVAPGFEFGPCLTIVGGLAVGTRVMTQSLARDEDELVILGIVGDPGPLLYGEGTYGGG